MSIRVQCGDCRTVMTVRDDYAGTKRRCPKCKGEFQVPTLEEARAAEAAKHAGGAPSEPDDPDFDPVAFLTGEKASGKSKPSHKPTPSKSTPAAEFDPMDVLEAGPTASKSGSGSTKQAGSKSPNQAGEKPAAIPPAEFDPLDVLATPSAPKPASATAAATAPSKPAPPPAPTTGTSAASAPPPTAVPEKPQPNRPSWAKAAPPPEQNDWEEPATAASPPSAPAEPAPAAAPEKPTPRRPSWAKAAPTPEVNDWDASATQTAGGAEAAAGSQVGEATTPAAPTPKRPSWAKPQPGETPAAGASGVRADASPAAHAAAEAMAATVGEVSSDNPALKTEAPRGPLIDRAALVAWFRRRMLLGLKTIAAALVLFGLSWLVIRPHGVDWKVIGQNERLQPAPVSGLLTVDGQPVANARVIFHPRGRQFRSSEGLSDSAGRYELHFCEGIRGAPPGQYRVQLHVLDKDGSDAGVTADGLLRDQSFEVPEGGGTVDLALSTKPPQS